MQMTDFCDHLYNESTDGYIQILKLNDENNSGERTIKIYNTKNDGLRDIVEELHKKEDNYREDFFFLSMDSVIFANNSKAMAAISPIAAK